MEGAKAVLLVVALLAAQLPNVFPSLPPTGPAFLWSPHSYGSPGYGVNEVVNYQTISPKDLAKSVLSEGGWSNLLCSGKNLNENVDVALIFVGRKLHSSDISNTKHLDPALLDLLKLSFTRSNMSIAYPYVDVSDEKGSLEDSLFSGFIENCANGLGVNRIAYLDTCAIKSDGLEKLQGMQSFQDFVGLRLQAGRTKNTDLIVYCDEGSEELDNDQSEGKTLSEITNFLGQSGATYTVLYASDPYGPLQYPSYRALGRLLAEKNASVDSTGCDGVCQIKSSLLEGIFVGIVLLIILISGLCCMMGIDTPTRFETPQES